jgi:hypothetical protein
MGGKTTTSTNQVTIPQDVLDRYNAVNTQAAKVAENPFQKYGTTAEDFVAQFNEQQNKGVAGINAVAGMGAAYENVDKYLNPYIKNVADTTRAQMEQAQEQAQSGALGTAVQSGAFGGDRAGVAAANLANQNQMAMGSTMANIYNQGYTQAIDTSMNDRNRMLGVAGAQLGAGTQMQQTEQAGLDALINQFQQEQGYPFQVAQFLANIAMGTGALSGSTTTTTQPAQIFSDRRLKHNIKKIGEADNGLPIYTFKYKGDEHHQTHVGFMADEVEKKNPDAVGLDPSGYKTVDYDKAAQSMGGGVHSHNKGEAFADGGVAGPYGSKVGQGVGVGSYVPQAYLPVGELMMADPAAATAHQSGILDALESAASMGKSVVEIRDLLNNPSTKTASQEAHGGAINGYADGGGVEPKLHGDYMSSTLAAQEAGKDKPELKVAGQQGQQGSALGNIASTIGSVATIAKALPMIFSSDRRLKHDIKRIGKTEKGLPIYTFKYKGDDREQTHVGFMADEVERDHPEAVGKRNGYKTVDYSQAHKFADGGVAGRHGYALDGTVEERLRDAMRITRDDAPAAQTLGSLPDARVVAAEAPSGYVGPNSRAEALDRFNNSSKVGRKLQMLDDAVIASGKIPIGDSYLPFGDLGNTRKAEEIYFNRLGNPSLGSKIDYAISQGNPNVQGFMPPVPTGMAAEAPTGVVPEKYVGPNSRSEAADYYLGLNNPTDNQLLDVLISQGLTEPSDNLLPPVSAGVVPSEGQMRPKPRPEGLGVTPAEGQMRPKPRPIGLAGADVAADTVAALNKAPAVTGVVAPVVAAPQKGPKTNTGEVIQGGYDPIIPLETQLRFITKELQQPEYSGYLDQTYASPADAATAFDSIYERSGGKGTRQAGLYANDIYNAAQNGNMEGLPPNVVAAYNHFIGTGMDSVQASGAAGRLMVESYARLDPNARNTLGGGNGTYGIAQHRGERLEQLADFAGVPLQALIDAPVSTPEGRYYSTKGDYNGGLAGNAEPTSGNRRTGGVKPYEERNALGRIIYDEDGRMSKDALLSILAGVGDMLSSPSPFLLPAIGAGVAGAAKTYMAREGQLADIAKTQADTASTATQLFKNSIYYNEALGQTFVPLQGGGVQSFADFMIKPAGPSMAGVAADQVIRGLAADAESRGIDLSTATPEQIFGGGAAPIATQTGQGAAPQTPAAGMPVPQVVAPFQRLGNFSMDSEGVQAFIQQAEARSRSAITPQDRENLNAQAAVARAAADSGTAAASVSFRNLNELSSTVAKGLFEGNLGPIGDWKAKVEGTISQVAAQFGIPYDANNADMQKEILNKLSSLSSDQMTADSAAATLYLQNKGIFPSIDSNEDAAAEITAEMMTKNMTEYEKGQFINDVYRSQTGTVKDLTGVEALFNREAGDLYQVEKTNIADLLKYSGDEKGDAELRKLVVDFFDDANRGAFKDQGEAQEALRAIFSALPGQYKVSSGLGRYFVQQGNQ